MCICICLGNLLDISKARHFTTLCAHATLTAPKWRCCPRLPRWNVRDLGAAPTLRAAPITFCLRDWVQGFQGLRFGLGLIRLAVGLSLWVPMLRTEDPSSSSYGLELHVEYFHQAGVVLVSIGLFWFPALKLGTKLRGKERASIRYLKFCQLRFYRCEEDVLSEDA